MNLLSKLFAGKKEEEKALGAVFLSGESGTRLPEPSSGAYTSYVRAYADKAWVYACVSVITDAVSGADFTLRDASGKNIPDHPALRLLWKPNPAMSGRTLRQWISGSLELTGNAYILKDARSRGGAPRELYPLLPNLVEIVPGGDARHPVDGYRYRAGGQTVLYPAEDVIHIKYFNPADFFYGLAPLAAARHAADTLSAAETYNRSFFDNSATISGILSTPNKLDEAARKRIMGAWLERYRGEKKAHRVALLEGGLSWQSVGISQKDMDFIAGMKLNRETVLGIFRVPPALVGLFEHAPQFNTKEQQKIFWQTCAGPKLTLQLEALTEFLLPDFPGGRDLYFAPDFSSISSLRESEYERAEAAQIYQEMGFTRDEIIDALGLPFGKSAQTKYTEEQ